MEIYNSILDTIGNTPLIRLSRLTEKEEGTIFAKLEFLSPGLSKKDRVALQMIEDAERKGVLARDQTVVELTSGNMGTGLAIVCRLKGYKFIAVMSKGNSIERAKMMQAFGAEVILVDQMPGSVPGQVSGEDLNLVEIKAQEITKQLGAFRADQFFNPSTRNVGTYRIAPEILKQLGDEKIDAFVDFMGTGGSCIGVAKALKQVFPHVKCFGVEPENAPFYSDRASEGKTGGHKIQGGGYHMDLDFVKKSDSPLDGFMTVTDREAIEGVRALALEECMFAGFSSGANYAAAKKLLKAGFRGKNILILIPDSGTKYLSTDLWD